LPLSNNYLTLASIKKEASSHHDPVAQQRARGATEEAPVASGAIAFVIACDIARIELAMT